MQVRIGTSGWSYKHWLGRFYPRKIAPSEMLKWYAQYFDTVEINASFYRWPSPTSFEQWRHSTPAGFCFAVKASRYLTHRKKLKDPEQPLETTFTSLEELGPKFGPILFQLPPRWRVNVERLKTFLALLPRSRECAIEFRDISWHSPEVLRLLRMRNVAFCIYDLAGFTSPVHLTADFAYVRFHGPGKAYQGRYSARTIDRWARQIENWRGSADKAFVYFNNDTEGNAIVNAEQLKARLEL